MKSPSSILSSPRRMILAGMLLVIPFIVLAAAGLNGWGWLGTLDAEIGTEIIEYRSAILTPIFVAITELGGVTFSVVFVLFVGAIIFFKWNRLDMAVWYVCTVALGAGVLNQAVKFIFQRPRPTVEHLVVQGGYSFPSGHSMGSMILFGALVFVIVQLSEKRALKWAALWLSVILIGLIGLSRVYLGVHFPSDVIGGFSLGAAWLAGSIAVYGLILLKQTK